MFFLSIAIGALVGVMLIRLMPARNQILYCRERDGRGMELNVADEDAVSLETHSSPELRFFKYGRSYEFRKRFGRAFTRFFGKEGTAYTWRLQGFSKTPTKYKTVTDEVPVLNDEGKAILDEKGKPVFKPVERQVVVAWKEKQVELEFPTLEDAVKARWGNEFYGTVPENMQEVLRNDKLLVTVNLEPGIVPEGYTPITESVIEEKADRDMASLIANSVKQGMKEPWIQWIFIFVAGMGAAMLLAKLMGWF